MTERARQSSQRKLDGLERRRKELQDELLRRMPTQRQDLTPRLQRVARRARGRGCAARGRSADFRLPGRIN